MFIVIKAPKNYQFNILLSILFTVASITLNTVISGGFALFFILSLGIIHGANDLKLLQQKKKNATQKSFATLLSLYIGVVVLGIFVFYRIPQYGLLAFVLVSCYHFGEQHLESNFTKNQMTSIGIHALYFFYGASVFGLLFSTQIDSVLPIVEQISGMRLPYAVFQWGLIVSFVCWSLCMLLLKELKASYKEELILLALLGVLFLVSDLLSAFALYFVIWHSIPSIQDQMLFLYGRSDFNFLKVYVYDSLIYWLLSLSSLVFVYVFIPGNLAYFLPLFFSFLAAITFPHAVVMGKLQLGKRSKERKEFNASASQEIK